MKISDIKRLTTETSPHYFSRKTLSFFGQRMGDFKVRKQPDGRYKITAPIKDENGRNMGQSVRFFNPINNELEIN